MMLSSVNCKLDRAYKKGRMRVKDRDNVGRQEEGEYRWEFVAGL